MNNVLIVNLFPVRHQYSDAFPLHAAAKCGDIHAIQFFSKLKHVNSYNEV